eukprot:763517-Hanusia_phi.AAC.2
MVRGEQQGGGGRGGRGGGGGQSRAVEKFVLFASSQRERRARVSRMLDAVAARQARASLLGWKARDACAVLPLKFRGRRWGGGRRAWESCR